MIARLFFSAWRAASPEIRERCPIEVVEGCHWEPYRVWVMPPGGYVEYQRLWIVPVALRSKETGAELMRFLQVQTAANAEPQPVPRWYDPEALGWVNDVADTLAEQVLDPATELPIQSLSEYLARKGIKQGVKSDDDSSANAGNGAGGGF
jgi:hypothetical protein